MQSRLFRKSTRSGLSLNRERGITMVLVAVAMVAIIAMAALSIDVVTLYLAREEAQRSADAAALAAARVLSVSGITGTADPATNNASWVAICGGSSSVASQTAQAVGIQNGVGSGPPTTVNVTYSAGGSGPSSTCAGLPAAFAVNPMVTVQVTRASLPTFFSRIWGRAGNSVSATATAEAFNPSNSGNVGNGPTGTITAVLPRCVKPWVVPNRDPLNSPGCPPSGPGQCQPLVDLADGSIKHAGISLNGTGGNGVIGENIWLVPDCQYSGATCSWYNAPPQANVAASGRIQGPPNLQYLPGIVNTASTAAPSCTGASAYQRAITGCDQSTNYQCGVQDRNTLDLSENPAFSHDTRDAVQCLIHEGDAFDPQPDGQDTLNPYAAPSSFPFEILAGSSTPLSGLAGKPISSSNSIVSLPIYDDTKVLNPTGQTTVTFVGFLQVFINAVDPNGNINVTILNVSGCSNGNGPDPVGPGPALGSSPVPIRLITPP
jgi:Flp pilus assembly protein TadG